MATIPGEASFGNACSHSFRLQLAACRGESILALQDIRTQRRSRYQNPDIKGSAGRELGAYCKLYLW